MRLLPLLVLGCLLFRFPAVLLLGFRRRSTVLSVLLLPLVLLCSCSCPCLLLRLRSSSSSCFNALVWLASSGVSNLSQGLGSLLCDGVPSLNVRCLGLLRPDFPTRYPMALSQHLHLLRLPLVDAAGHVRGVGVLPDSLSKPHGGAIVLLPESAHFLGVRSFVSPLLEVLAVHEAEQHYLVLVLD